MTSETLAYVESVNGREWTHDDQQRIDFDFLVRSLPIDLDAELLDPFDFLLNDPTPDWMAEFGDFLDREYPTTTPIIDVAY